MICTPIRSRRAAVLLAAALLSNAAWAGVASVSHTTTKPLTTTNWSETLSLPKFDPALGTLLSATLTYDGLFEASFSATNLSAQPAQIDVTVGGTLSLLCPAATGNCGPGGISNQLITVNEASSTPFPNVGVNQTIMGTLGADPLPILIAVPSGATSLQLADFIGPGTISFPAAATGQSIVVGPGVIQSQIQTRAGVELTVTYNFDVVEQPCLQNGPDEPGSLLLFPRFDSRAGRTTVITVTNTNCSFIEAGNLFEGTVDVEFVYVGRFGPGGQDLPCLKNDLTVRLSPCDTFTSISRFHNPQAERGFLYVFAKSPTTGEAIVFNHLIGQAMYVTAADLDSGARDALNARTFLGIGSAAGIVQPKGTPTNLDGDSVRDLDGREYSPAPDKILIPRFLGQDPDGAMARFRSTLVLINLSGGSLFDAVVDFAIWDDSENKTSAQHTFRCWDEVRLIDLGGPNQGGAWLESTLDASSTSMNEILGANSKEAGWFTIDGNVAFSDQDQTLDPVIYAVLFERVNDYEVCDLPYELCTDPRGDLYEFGFLFDEDPTLPVGGL